MNRKLESVWDQIDPLSLLKLGYHPSWSQPAVPRDPAEMFQAPLSLPLAVVRARTASHCHHRHHWGQVPHSISPKLAGFGEQVARWEPVTPRRVLPISRASCLRLLDASNLKAELRSGRF